ncbi:hypothetical protein [Acetobacterium sp. K1/6]|jgi:hypothetical protein|uniref:hypothetical protein n=1 Tax=Acetobacterium sp. K1/6 TaxID=3055467 RepID=UPI002ACAF292|nr:hypothetical protein [Acetobacterium sp. K1/6]MDZ5726784.1 hypothetical protein [Acetobacterium sp. K1/6]
MWEIALSTTPIQESEKNIIEKIDDGWFGIIASLFSNMFTWLAILGIIILCIAVVITIARYRKRVNGKSKEKIDQLVKEKKYIRGLFIELNDSKENLRYFLYRGKWKKRIIQDFNSVFDDEYGDLLKEVFRDNGDVLFSLGMYSKIDKVIETIEKTRRFLNDVHNDQVEYPSKYQDSMVIFRIYSNKYDEILLPLSKKAEYIKNNYVILSGSAGNGKTNLLCSFSELLFSLKYPCVFMNAKEMENDIERYFEEQLNFLKLVEKHEKCMIAVEILSRLRFRPTYVIIDAVNENNNKEFLEKLPVFLDKLLDKKYIRVLITCRSEYFEARYKKILLENMRHIALYDNIQEQMYSRNAVNRMFDIYSKEFIFNGVLSLFVRNKLSQQLLLMRMFFETHVGTKQIVNDMDYYMLYDKYINQIGEQKQVDIRAFLDKIVKIMTERNDYGFVSDKLISEKDEHIYEKVDGTILLSKTLIHHEDSILKNEEGVIYFVFDELRDYCIARYNLMRMCKSQDDLPEKEQIIQYLDGLFQEEAVCFEGVVNYIYRDYNSRNDEQLCSEIIEKFIKPADVKANGRNYMSNERLKGWGLRLIFQNSQKQLVCEEEYLKYIVYENPGNLLSSLFSFLVLQEKEHGPYSLEILFHFLRDIHDKKVFIKVIDNCVGAFGRDCISHTDFFKIDEELHDVSKEALARFRHFEVIFMMLFKWEGRKKLKEQIKRDCDIDAVKEEIRQQYYFDGEGNDDYY